ncbi:site-specific DNA-methyltransferase [bacterium]|nr:site-specific DNA-methyltransferase [bacterium]
MSIRRRGQLALKVVERPSYYEGELCSHEQVYESSAHSLHQLCPLPFEIHPAAVSVALRSLSRAGDTILDPFCGSGTVGLESLLQERKCFLADLDPVVLTIAAAKLRPADLTEVALWLQMSPLQKPAAFTDFEEVFSHFYDAGTFRELSALRRLLLSNGDQLSRFLRALVLGLLHGRGAGNFSAYSPSECALSVHQQGELNRKRNQYPDYRALAPRLLRKSAVVLQDGVPSVLHGASRANEGDSRLKRSDARELRHIQTGAIDLILTNPSIPRHRVAKSGNWLRRWFLGYKGEQSLNHFTDTRHWNGAMNEFFIEAARTVRPGGRLAVFSDRRFSDVAEISSVKDRLLPMVEDELSYYWEPECFLTLPEQKVSITGRKRSEHLYRFRSDCEGVIVFRRR